MLVGLLSGLLMIAFVVGMSIQEVVATTTTVTLKLGALESYGTYSTYLRWITHINGEALDLDDEPGVTRSYAYCVQPSLPTPASGEYPVTVIDDDDTGRLAKMRKMIYYLPGSYGYKQKTKARWFSNLPSGTSAYTIGHVALSYLYDNCNSGSDAWMGTNTAIKDKTLDIIDDLKNLKDPPDDFEVFWIKVSGHQDTFGAFYRTEYGNAKVKKTSSNESITTGNVAYSLKGAKYTLYEDNSCKTIAKCKDGSSAVLTTKDDGVSNTIEIETGDYYIKETSAPKGYALNTAVEAIEVEKGKTTTYSDKDIPKSNPVGVLVEKVDKETGLAKPIAGATLEGAEFTIRYYDIEGKGASEQDLLAKVKDKNPATINGKKAEWVYRTDAEGRIDFSKPDSYLVGERPNFYKNEKGEFVLPIGIVTIQETTAPRGYCIDKKIYAREIADAGTTETLKTLNPLTGKNAIKEQIKRGDISFTKSSEGVQRMAHVLFKLTSNTTGESHTFMTDENGYVNTSNAWNEHSNNTNRGEEATDGIWFSGYVTEEDKEVKPDNTLCALPYDTYTLEELSCESNKGHQLFTDTVTVSRNNVVLDMGTFDDKLIPHEEEEESPPDDDDDEEVVEHHDKPSPPKKIVKHHDTPSTPDKTVEHGPKTGDISAIIPYLAAMILAAAEIVVLTIKRRGGRLKSSKDDAR